jgi:Zn-dependent alcohol dehydrogenase
MTLGRMAVLQPFGFLAIEEAEVPAPTGHQVAVEMFAAAITAADVALLARSDESDWQPLVPGLEGAGVVTAIGEAVTRVNVGDQVVIGATSEGAERADRPVSTWTTNALVDEHHVAPFPRDVGTDRDSLGLLGATAAVAATLATQVGEAEADEPVVVAGSGGLALATVATLRAAGAASIVAVAPDHAHAAAAAAGASLCLSIGTDLGAAGARRGFDCREEISPDPGALDPGLAWTDARTQPLDRDRAMAALTQWMAAGHFSPSVAIGKRYTIEQINEAVMEIEGGRIAGAGLVVMEPLK